MKQFGRAILVVLFLSLALAASPSMSLHLIWLPLIAFTIAHLLLTPSSAMSTSLALGFIVDSFYLTYGPYVVIFVLLSLTYRYLMKHLMHTHRARMSLVISFIITAAYATLSLGWFAVMNGASLYVLDIYRYVHIVISVIYNFIIIYITSLLTTTTLALRNHAYAR